MDSNPKEPGEAVSYHQHLVSPSVIQLTHLIPSAALWGGNFYYLNFTDEETEEQND